MEPSHPKHESWISISSLKEAVDIKQALKPRTSSRSGSSDSACVSPESSITIEWKPNTCINQSISFSSIHDTYCDTMESNAIDDLGRLDKSDIEAMSIYIQKKERKLATLQNKYQRDTGKVKAELKGAKDNLETMAKEMQVLTQTINKLQQEHAQQIQNLQARHEQKIQRGKQDFDLALADINEKTAALVTRQLHQEFSAELLRLRDAYEDQIEQLRVDHEFELQEKEEGFEQYLAEYTSKTSEIAEIEEYYETKIHSIQTEKSQEINRLKRELTRKTKIKPDSQIEDQQLCIEELKSLVKEQDFIIQDQQNTIDQLSAELQEIFRNPLKQNSIDLCMESDLQTVIGQITTFLDPDYLQKDVENTLNDPRSRIDFQTSSGRIPLQNS